MTSPSFEQQLLLMAYLDGELSPEEHWAFEAQLRRDPELARQLRAHQAMSLFVNENQRALLPRGLDSLGDRVLAAAQKKPVTRKSTGRVIALFSAFAAAAAVGLFAYTYTSQSVPGASPSTELALATSERTAPSLTATSKQPAVATFSVSQDVDAEDLEVGNSATVLYYNVQGKSLPVIWILDHDSKGSAQ